MIRWTFSDASFLKTGLASAWHSDSVEQTLQKLKSLKLKDQRRALRFVIKGKDFRFATSNEAIGFLQPLADQNLLLRAKGTTPSPECPAAVPHHSALRCPEGHAIHRKGDPFGWWQDKKTCHACNKSFGPHTSYWRCTHNCKYNVCHHCFQMAACNEAQQMLEGSYDSTECGSDSAESTMDFRVSSGASVETWHFWAHRPWPMQLEQLAKAFEVPHAVLIHSQGLELEVIQSISQLQALPGTAQLTLETPEALLAQLLRDTTALRHLVSTLCASEELAAEGIRQDALRSLLMHLTDADSSTVPLAAAGLCALFKCQVGTVRAQLLDLWPEFGTPLMSCLMRDSSDGVAPVLMWLLQELEIAVDTFHKVAVELEGGYLTLSRRHPAALQLLLQRAEGLGAEHLVEAIEQQCPEIKVEGLDSELLKLLLDASVAFGHSCGGSQKLVQQGKWLKEEQHFVSQLQQKLRCAVRSLKAMVPLVSLGDAQLEKSLQKIVVDGWDSTEWPDGQNLLHFLCEHHGDASAVRLAAELCPNLEVRDGQNLRAMDYALRNPNSAVAEQLLLVSQERLGQSFLEEDVLKEDVFKTDKDVPEGEEAEPPTEHGEADPPGGEGDAPQRTQLGALFMLRTRLAKAMKENDLLREKVGELELLRTRLAILSEKPQGAPAAERIHMAPAPASATPSSAEGHHSLTTVKELKDLPTGCLESSSTSTEDGETETASHPETADDAELLADGTTETERMVDTAPPMATPEATPEGSDIVATPTKVPPKGKGKGKGKAPAPTAPGTLSGSGSDAGKGEAKGKAKGKGKVSAVEPTKPEVKPAQDLKTIPWTRYVVGAQITEGTIWDQVNEVYEHDHIMEALPMDEIEKRFGKATGQGVAVVKKEVKKPKTVKLSSIAQEQRFQIEVCLRTLPVGLNTGSKAARAIQDLDRSVMSCEAMSSLRRFLCPTDEQEQELRAKRRERSETPEPLIWDPVEQYMEELLVISGCSLRLSCWEFLYNLSERLAQLQENLQRFERMVRCFLTSTEIPVLLSLVLAFGNYLNGGKNEKRLGRADGFHVELLGRPGGLDLVNDTQGRNVRQLIFETFCEKYPSHSERLFEELAPVFDLVQRRIGKDAQGVPALRKSVRVEIEDLDKQLSQLKSEFTKKHHEMKECLKLIDDPAEKFVIEIPREFDDAKQHIDDLIRKKDTTLQQFKVVLANFKAETYRGDSIVVDGQLKDGNPKSEMTSEVWCKIWDNFFVPPERVLSFDAKRQKSLIEPRFCKDQPLTVESLALLWGLTKEEPRRRSTTVCPRKGVPAATRRRASA